MNFVASYALFAAPPSQLDFYLNGDRHIEAYSAHGDMTFYEDPQEFEGKDILDILPYSKLTRERIMEGFHIASEKNEIVRVYYDVEGNEYAADILPLHGTKGKSYFVTVWQIESAEILF